MTSTPQPCSPIGPLPPVDYRVYLVTSGATTHTIKVAAAVAAAGAGMIQIREKTLPARQLTDFVLAVSHAIEQAIAGSTKRPIVLVDDRVDVALAALRRGAAIHGVHLGQDDIDPLLARELLGEHALIGLTTGTLELVQQAQAFHEQHPGVIDYLGAGPMRPTPTKHSGRPPLGVDGYRTLVAATSLPIVAIGDVTPEDIPSLKHTGVAGCAMVRSLMQADDPAARTLAALAHWQE